MTIITRPQFDIDTIVKSWQIIVVLHSHISLGSMCGRDIGQIKCYSSPARQICIGDLHLTTMTDTGTTPAIREIKVALHTNINKAVTLVESALVVGGSTVVVEGRDKSIGKAITIVEIVRRKRPELKQENELYSDVRADRQQDVRQEPVQVAAGLTTTEATESGRISAGTDEDGFRDVTSADFPAAQPIRPTATDSSHTGSGTQARQQTSKKTKVSCLRITLKAPG